MGTLSDIEFPNETSKTRTRQNRLAETTQGNFPSMRTSELRYADENMREEDSKDQKSGQKEETYQQISDGETTLEMETATRGPNQRVMDETI